MEFRKLVASDKEAYFKYLKDWKPEKMTPTQPDFTRTRLKVI